jgi:hypothetical protein
MDVIAHDEAGHAELAWEVAAWLETRLTAEDRAAVRAAAERARRELVDSLDRRGPAPFASALGLPDPTTTRRLLGELSRAFWTPGAVATG